MSASNWQAQTINKIQGAKEMSDEEKLYRHSGVLYPTIMCPLGNLKALENITAREDDIMLVAYPKCGFNWMVGVLKKIIEASTGEKYQSKMPPLIEFMGPDVIKGLDQAPSPRFLGTHMHPDNIPATFYEKKAKMLVILRNPKDTLVSYYHFHNNNPVLPCCKSWDSFYSDFMSGDVCWGSYFDHALAWDKKMDDSNVMFITYEDLKQDLSEGIRQVSAFYGFSLTEAQIQQLAEQSTFKAMKENSSITHGVVANAIFRKGEVGDWKNYFTAEQSKEMDELFNKRLAGTRLGAKLNYQLHYVRAQRAGKLHPFRCRVMQQKLCSRGSGSFLLERNGQACGAVTNSVTSCDLHFRCPRCGEKERFRSLASLRAHLEYRHSYRSPDVITGGFSITGKLPDPLTAAIPWHDMSLPTRRGQQNTGRPPHVRSLSDSRDSGYLHSYSSVRRRTQSVGVGTQAEEDEEDEHEAGTEGEDVGEEDEEEDEEAGDGASLGPPPDPDLDLDLDLVEQNPYSGLETAAASAAVRRRLASILRAADSTMQRRLAKVSTELAQTDTELLCERAHSQHLAQERQEVAERERSLSRQVDVAVMVIAALREQLNASENELERREREVITIQKFLEAAARQETCGKVRIQHFIENLLRRIALAERLVEYYQVNGSPLQCNHYKQHQQQMDNGPHRITKSRSAGGQLSSSGLHDSRTHSSSHFGSRPSFSKPGGERDREREHRERLAQSSRLFCRPEHRDDIWNHQRRRSTGYEA
ncbi:hypothetical protein Q5P01_021867 [Channa striata]|uniref:Sulfotransferase n=1 Tax=Channa striata TaxID=64152 RepID=A0AA88S125_CHASR|nr:hypothetical protein Q5P01_021867 [Channa striata]